jgi:hypothetical protein
LIAQLHIEIDHTMGHMTTHVAIAMLSFGMVKEHEILDVIAQLPIINAAKVERYLFLHMNLFLSHWHL